MNKSAKSRRWWIGLMIVILTTGVLFAWWNAARADRVMRADLLQQARLVAHAVNIVQVQALTGTKADLTSTDYLKLKEQLTAVRSVTPQCRFVYLMGRKSDGTVFFFVDSEPSDSEDESPAGQIYDETTVDLLRVFDTKTAAVEGPVTDAWGTWVSALVPLIDTQSGELVAVLGMDIDAHTWKWDVAAKAALPVGLMLVLMIGAIAALLASVRTSVSPKPVLQRLMFPLTAILILIFTGGGVFLWQEHRTNLAEKTATGHAEIADNLQEALKQQASGLAAAAQPIAADTRVHQALRENDADRLLVDWRSLFETLHRENNFTHLYFSDTNRICLLRIHNPEKRGDKIDRFTALEAERTKRTASGIELGPLGTFTLRVVLPVFEEGELVGYVELGKEIEDVLQNIHTRSGHHIAVAIFKESLERQTWEAGMHMLDREADWDRLTHSVIIYASQSRLPDTFATMADHNPGGGHAHGETDREVDFDGMNWRVSATPIHDASGKEVGDLLVMSDITSEKAAFYRMMTIGGVSGGVLLATLLGLVYVLLRRTDNGIQAQQAELRKNEEKLKLLSDNLSVGVAMISPSMEILETNTQMKAWFPDADYERHPYCHQTFSYPSRNTPCKRCPVIEVFRDGQSHTVERQARISDGTRFLRITATPVTDSEGKIIAAIEMIEDITESKKAENALRESESRLRVITDSAQDAILMMNQEGSVSFWNPAAERILGYTSGEAIGQDLHSLIVPPRYHEAHKAAFPAFQQTGLGSAVGKTLDLNALRKDGKEIPVQLSLSAIQINGGWHAVGILRDITAQKLAEKNLLETNRQLEEATLKANQMAVKAEMASIAKSEFLANMSHEIRTPMNGVIGMTGLLLDTELNEEQRRYAEIVRASGESLLGLINDILDFSKIEAGKLDLETLDFDLQSLLDDFAATMAVRTHNKGLELICAADPGVPTLLSGDPGRLRQILTNLTGNAIKFTHQGEVAVRVEVVHNSSSSATIANREPLQCDPVFLRFSVRDTGIGIPKDKIGILYDKFTQLDASTTRKYGGTGLGLAISKQLIELMGGEVGVKSEEGKGSEFWFTARFGRQVARDVAVIIPAADLAGVRTLIVDDNATNREILTTRLKSWGMRPYEAQDGPVALMALHKAMEENDPFRIAVIDMQMPEMDGEELGRAIKADSRLAGTRLVMLTSLGTRGDARHFQEIGFAAYATKPIRQEELKGVLSQTLAKRGGKNTHARFIATRHTVRETLNLFAGRKARILLAEDNITNQQVALGILKKLGLKADAVANGREAITALKTIPYDLVLMDVQMPEMDGLEATHQIRNPQSAVRNHQIPIIAMTAHAMQGNRERYLKAGMNDYVSKPVAPKALAEAIARWLPREEKFTAQDSEVPESKAFHSSLSISHSSIPIWDRPGLLERLMGDEELIETIMEEFLTDIPQQIETLLACLEAGDAPGAERSAHTIKGVSANVGCEALCVVASEMEKDAKSGDLNAVQARFAELEKAFFQLKQAMEEK
jgi:PAS domain S-box-containing protein